ncbi:MAG: RCC1 domain-containing protein, partial [Bdellovibrionota bacterium]
MSFLKKKYQKREIRYKTIYIFKNPLKIIKKFPKFFSYLFFNLFLLLFSGVFFTKPCFAFEPILDSIKQVASNGNITCAISASGELWCWGVSEFLNVEAKLGSYVPVPQKITELTDVSSVSIGRNHICAISNNKLYCWGRNSNGQLGVENTDITTTPQLILSEFNISKVVAEHDNTCAITTTGVLYCWGNNEYGSVGNNSLSRSVLLPTQILTNVSYVSLSSASARVACAIKTNGELWCWGGNAQGQVGIGSLNDVVRLPQKVLEAVSNVSLRSYNACAIKINGELFCWGDNQYTYKPIASEATSKVLTPLKILDNTKQVSMGRYHICAITNSDELYCRGANNYGQIGKGASTSSL